MKFYGRYKEIETLQRIEKISASYSQMTVITGRRRIGKTTLVKHACKQVPMVYFFVGRKSETMLCNELSGIVKELLDLDLGAFTSFSRLFSILMAYSATHNFTLVLDEFQNLRFVNTALFSEIQNVWDSQKDESHINLILCGSVYTMMTKIFDDRHEPLYGRATNRIRLQPFTTSVLKDIIADFNPLFCNEDLLTLYMTTGGVAKYVEQMMTHGAWTKEGMLREFIGYGSYFIPEGKEMLMDEFGRDSGNYFSVLTAIADGRTERGDIKSYIDIEPGGYLDKLEKNYDLVYRYRPYNAPAKGQNVKYGIKDNFLKFWFRFIHKYLSAIEIGNTDYVLAKINDDYDTYSGLILEEFFRQKYRETGFYNTVTNYWEKKGQNEIDLIAVNEVEKRMIIGEVKRQKHRISLETLHDKARNITSKKRGYTIEYIALAIEDM
uniref:ATP-binding protein n=1 Tax=Prevotella sp. GTC17260 TaxID=3236796 RepID=A0AB33JCQ1_9BACT